jgi:hypothetical protein
MLATPASRYCHSHSNHAKLDATSLAAELSQAAAALATPEDVHRVTAKIFLALCEDRISLKKAGMLSYLAQTLLRAHREIAIHRKMEMEWQEMEQQKASESSGSIRGWIVPRPDRSDPPLPSAESVTASPQSDSGISPEIQPVSDTAEASLKQTELRAESSEPSAAPAKKSPPKTPPRTTVSTATQTTPPPDLNHFYPIDFTLPPGLQDHRKNIPPPDAEELRSRELSRRYVTGRRSFR